MALEVQQRLAGDIADLFAVQVEQGRLAGEEAVDTVEIGGGVDVDHLVPAGAVGGEVLFAAAHGDGSIVAKPQRAWSTFGRITLPSDCWPFSMRAAMVRGRARALPLRVWTKRVPEPVSGR